MKRRKQVNLQIWCDPEIKEKFKLLTVKYRFRSYEEFLAYLLRRAEREWLPETVY